MAGAEPVFPDTNVLVYAHIEESPMHEVALAALKSLESSNRDIWISFQVLRELLAVMTRPVTHSHAEFISALMPQVEELQKRYLVASDSPAVYERLEQLMLAVPTGGKQVHDASIVATMLANDVHCLVTNNVRDFERFGEFIAVVALSKASALCG